MGSSLRDQILAFRYARHNLGSPLSRSKLRQAAEPGLQTGMPGTALLALAARVNHLKSSDFEDALQTEKSLVETHTLRGATYIVPSEDYPIFTIGVYPTDEKSLEHFLGPGADQLKESKVSPAEAVKAVTESMLAILKNKALTQDEIHAEWRKRLPKKYLWPCKGCKTSHVHPSVVGTVCASGLACFGPMIEGDSAFVLSKNWLPKSMRQMKREDAARELVKRYLRYFGPADPAMFASWTGTSKLQAIQTWSLIEDQLKEVGVEKKKLWLLEEDWKSFRSAPAPKGVHLLPPRDPFLDQRDRDILIPEKAKHSKVWKVLANPGVLLIDGEVSGTWRGQKKSKELTFILEPFKKLTKSTLQEVRSICEKLTVLREAESYKLKVR